MNRPFHYATLMLSRLLDPREREVALGDVAELGYVGGQGFTSMLGLVLRRQWHPWKQWRPWFVLVAMAIPIAVLLASFCNQLDGQLFPVLVMWSHHRVAYATGLKPSAEAFGFLLNVTALVLWSWTCGLAVGALAGTTLYVPCIVFCVISVAMGWRLGPISIVLLWTTAWGWLPVVLTCLLVLAPAYHGLRHGGASSKMRWRRLVFLATSIAIASILVMWKQGWDGVVMENWSQGGGPLTLVELISRGDAWEAVASHTLTVFVLTSPAIYLLAEEISRGMGKRGLRQRL